MAGNLIARVVRFLTDLYGMPAVLRGFAIWLKEDLHKIAIGRVLLDERDALMRANMRAIRVVSELEQFAGPVSTGHYFATQQSELMSADDMPEFHLTCTISTAHVTEADGAYLLRWKVNDYHCGIWCAQYQHGHILSIFGENFLGSKSVDEKEWLDAHPSIAAVAKWAAEHRIRYIVLDSDGSKVEWLPTYEW